MRELGRRGADATNARFRDQSLTEDELPPLRTPQDAEKLLEIIARAIATGRIEHRAGDAVTRATRAWLAAHQDGSTHERIDTLAEAIDQLRRERLKVIS